MHESLKPVPLPGCCLLLQSYSYGLPFSAYCDMKRERKASEEEKRRERRNERKKEISMQ